MIRGYIPLLNSNTPLLTYRERRKLSNSLPVFRLKSVGESALLTVDKDQRVPLFMSDLQALLTYTVCGDRAPYWPHR